MPTWDFGFNEQFVSDLTAQAQQVMTQFGSLLYLAVGIILALALAGWLMDTLAGWWRRDDL